MQKLKSKIKLFIGWPLSILAIGFIVKFLLDRRHELSKGLNEINSSLIFLSFLLFILFFFLRSIAWKKLLSYMGHEVGLLENSYRYATSELKRFVPGNIWALLARGVQFHNLGIEKTTIGKAILFEVQLTIVGSLVASLPALSYILNSSQELQNKLISLLPISILAAVFFFAVITQLLKKKFNESGGLIERIYLPGLKTNQKIILTVFSAIIFFIFGIANFLVFLSIFPNNLNLAIELSAFFAFAFLVGYLSFITPMGLGVREAVVSLGLLKTVSLVDSSFFAIFSRVILIVSELIYVSLVFLLFKLAKQNR